MRAIIESIKKNKAYLIDKHMPSKSGPEVTDSERVQSFKQAYDQYQIDTYGKARDDSDAFHPSILGTYSGNCQRLLVYQLRGVQKSDNTNARVIRVFRNGNQVHERVQADLDALGECINEIAIEHDDPPIRGHGDSVFVWIDKILVEIKSCSQEVFDNRKKFKKPKPEHFDQANIYAHILGLDIIWILYDCKNNQDYEIFECATNHVQAEKVFKKWRKTYAIYKAGELPPRPYKPESKQCTYCPVKEHCWQDTQESI